MTVSSEVCIVLGALFGIVAACITPCLISRMSEDNETKKETNESIVVDSDQDNVVSTEETKLNPSEPIIVVHDHHNIVRRKQTNANQSKPTIVVHGHHDEVHIEQTEANQNKSTTVVHGHHDEVHTEQIETNLRKATIEVHKHPDKVSKPTTVDHGHHDEVLTKQTETNQRKATIVVHNHHDNVVHTEQTKAKQNTPTIMVHDPNNNMVRVEKNEKIYGESTIQYVLQKMEELPKLLDTFIVNIDPNGECSEESSTYEDARTHITTFSDPVINIHLHPDVKLDCNDDETEYNELPQKASEPPSKKSKLKQTLSIIRKGLQRANDKTNVKNDLLARQSTLIDSESKQITTYEKTIKSLESSVHSCECCKSVTKNDIAVSRNSKNNTHDNIPKQPSPIQTKGRQYSPYVETGENSSEENGTFEEIELVKEYSESNQKTKNNNNRIQVTLHPSTSPVKKLIRHVKNFFIFKKNVQQKDNYRSSGIKAKCNSCTARSY